MVSVELLFQLLDYQGLSLLSPLFLLDPGTFSHKDGLVRLILSSVCMFLQHARHKHSTALHLQVIATDQSLVDLPTVSCAVSGCADDLMFEDSATAVLFFLG